MANTIITKNSATATAVPTAGQLVQGELAVNVTDKRLFTENSGGTVVELGVNPSSVTTGNASYTGTLTGGTGVVNIGSGQVYKDASGNLGIGTSSPTQKLTIQTATATNGGILLGVDGSTYGAVGSGGYAVNGGTITDFGLRATTNMVFATGTSSPERMRITSTGSVGIGTSSPNGNLHIVSSGTETGGDINANADELVLDNSAGNVGITFKSPNTANARINFGDPQDNNVGAILYDHSSNYLSFYVNASERLRMELTSAGNVGIGTTAPPSYGSTFTVVQASNSGSGVVQAQNTTNSVITEIESEGTRGAVGTRTNHDLAFKTNQTERMRLDLHRQRGNWD
jgi:hypothetical protein